MLRQTRQPMSVFLIPVNQSKQLWHHSSPEYINIIFQKELTCQTGYTNHDRHKIKIAHDVIDKQNIILSNWNTTEKFTASYLFPRPLDVSYLKRIGSELSSDELGMAPDYEIDLRRYCTCTL